MKCSYFYLFTTVNKYRIQMKITRCVFVFNDPVFQVLMALHMSDSLAKMTLFNFNACSKVYSPADLDFDENMSLIFRLPRSVRHTWKNFQWSQEIHTRQGQFFLKLIFLPNLPKNQYLEKLEECMHNPGLVSSPCTRQHLNCLLHQHLSIYMMCALDSAKFDGHTIFSRISKSEIANIS